MSNKVKVAKNSAKTSKPVAAKAGAGKKVEAKDVGKVKIAGVTLHRKVPHSVRPNRGHTQKSKLGDRHWIYRGVTKVDGRNKAVEETSEKDATAFTEEQANAILEKAMQRPDVVAGRLFPKKADGKTPMRGVWLAFASENGVKTA